MQPNSPPRVCVVAYTEYPWDPRVRREAEILANDGYVVHVISLRPKSGPSPIHLNGVHLHEVPLSPRRGGKIRYAFQYAVFFLESTLLLLRLHLRKPFQLVHVHSLPDFQVFCALPTKPSRTAVILDLHEALPEIFAVRFRVPLHSLWARIAALLEQVSCRFADHVIAANDGIRSAVLSRGCPPERITTVYNPGDSMTDLESVDALRQELNPPRGRLIVHAGGVNPDKDLETLLRAMARLPPELNTQLVVAGDGEPTFREALVDLAGELGISGRVHFVGRLSPARAHGLMGLADLGVVTLVSNPLTEIAWPNRVVEFANLGKPLIVPRLRFLRQTLRDAANYYSPGDPESLANAIVEVLRAPDQGRSIAEKARQVCRPFGRARMRDVLLHIYRVFGGIDAG